MFLFSSQKSHFFASRKTFFYFWKTLASFVFLSKWFNIFFHISRASVIFCGTIGSFNFQFLTSRMTSHYLWRSFFTRSNVTRNKKKKFSNGSTLFWASPFQLVTTRTSWKTELFSVNSPTNWPQDALRRSKNVAQTSSWWKMFKGGQFWNFKKVFVLKNVCF